MPKYINTSKSDPYYQISRHVDKQEDTPPLKSGTNKLKDPDSLYTTMGYKGLKTSKPLFLKIFRHNKRLIMNILSMTGTNKFAIPHTNSHYQVYTKA